MMARSRLALGLLGVLLLLVGLALWLRSDRAPEVSSGAAPAAAERLLQPMAQLGGAEPLPAASAERGPRKTGPRRLSPERQQLRERVASTLREREQKRAAAAPGPTSTASSAADERAGSLVDKTGQLTEEELRILNHELMPLISECLAAAHERNPELKGMLAVELSFASAEELGSIVETLEPAPINDLGDEALLECVRQSAFSVEFPVPGKDGRAGGMLTIPFGVDPESWQPRAEPAETSDESAASSPR